MCIMLILTVRYNIKMEIKTDEPLFFTSKRVPFIYSATQHSLMSIYHGEESSYLLIWLEHILRYQYVLIPPVFLSLFF